MECDRTADCMCPLCQEVHMLLRYLTNRLECGAEPGQLNEAMSRISVAGECETHIGPMTAQ